MKARAFQVVSGLAGILLFLFNQTTSADVVTVRVGGQSGSMSRIGKNGYGNPLLAFVPAMVTIKPGDTVEWDWDGGPHSTTSGTPDHPSGLWDSGVHNVGATFTHKFDTAGTFSYYCMIHGSCCGMTGSVIVAAPPPTTSTLGDISTRVQVETGDNALIGGFIITGTQPKKVIVRAIGPSLPLAGTLANPSLELDNSAGQAVASNDNWMDATNRQEIIDSTVAPSNNLESAILMDLTPAAYTAIVRGVNNTTGIAVVEAYDLDSTVDSKLANISTRGLVQTDDDVMIGGFIIQGTDMQKVIVRAIGPSLPVTGKLADPTLELHDAQGALLFFDDNWRDTQEAEIIASTIPPLNDAESAIVQTLAPSAYTAIVRGKNGTTGVALIEVYALAPD